MSESQAGTSASSSSGNRNNRNDNNGLGASATVEEQFASISAKLNNLIQNTETKTSNIRNRILNSSLEPHFLALEQKVVASEYVNHLKELQNDVNRLKQIATEEKLNKENELKSQSEIFKEELFKDVIQLLESEMSCVICSEVFIKPAVIDCGHSYCNYCINKWTKESQKKECPICRKIIVSCTKHVEFDNFICKIYTLLSQEIREKRLELVAEREKSENAVPNHLPAPTRQRMPVFHTNFVRVNDDANGSLYGGFGIIEDDDIAARLLFEQELDHMFYYNPGRMSSTPVPHSYPSSTGDYDDPRTAQAAWLRRINDAEESEPEPHTPISVEPIVSSDEEENEMDTMPQNDFINDRHLETPVQQSQQYSNSHSFDPPRRSHFMLDPTEQQHRCPYMNGSTNNSSIDGYHHQHIHPSIPYINIDVAQQQRHPYPRVNTEYYSTPMYHHPTSSTSSYPAYQVPPPAHQQNALRNDNYFFRPPPAHQQQHRTSYYNEPPRSEQAYRNNNYTSNQVFSRPITSSGAVPTFPTGDFGGTIHTTPPDTLNAFMFPIHAVADSNSNTANNNTEDVENRSNNSASRSQSESPEVIHEVIHNRGESAQRNSYFTDNDTNPNAVVNISGNGDDRQFSHRVPHHRIWEVPNHRQSRNETNNLTEQNIQRNPEGQSLHQHQRIRRYPHPQNMRRPNSSSGSYNRNINRYRFRTLEDHRQ